MPVASMELKIEHIAVAKAGMTLEVRTCPWDARISKAQADNALRLLPNLARHVCVNEKGETCGDDVVGTQPAHLLEHVAIELMAQAHGSGKGLMGHTSFLEERGLMLVKLTYKDDIVALDCIKRAVAFVNSLQEGDKR